MVHQIGGSIGLSLTITLTHNIQSFANQYNASTLIVALLMLITFRVTIFSINPGTTK